MFPNRLPWRYRIKRWFMWPFLTIEEREHMRLIEEIYYKVRELYFIAVERSK